MVKKEAKPKLIRWALRLQEFDFDVKDRERCETQVVDQLSQLENKGKQSEELEIDNYFPKDQVLETTLDLVTWYADFANYLLVKSFRKTLYFTKGKSSYMM